MRWPPAPFFFPPLLRIFFVSVTPPFASEKTATIHEKVVLSCCRTFMSKLSAWYIIEQKVGDDDCELSLQLPLLFAGDAISLSRPADADNFQRKPSKFPIFLRNSCAEQ